LISAIGVRESLCVSEACALAQSRDGGTNFKVTDDEKAFQEKWLSKLNLSEAEYVRRYREGVAKGVVLAATDTYQTAADARFNGFHAGAFTYFLTQHLWQSTSTVSDALAQVNTNIPEKFGQTPRADVKVGSGYESKPLYFIETQQPSAAEKFRRSILRHGILHRRYFRA
jgi:hypothetical protein